MSVHYDRGCLLYEQNRLTDAEKEFKLAILEEPESGIEHAMLARVYLGLKRDREAEAEAKEALRLDPVTGVSQATMAQVCIARDRYKDAEPFILEVLRIDPENVHGYELLAQVKLIRSDPQAALEAAEQGLAIEPGNITCSTFRTVALTRLGRQVDALEESAGALSRNPDDDMAHTHRGWALLHQGNAREALPHFREALRLDPTYEHAREGMIEALKGRFWFYRQVLWILLWLNRQKSWVQIGVWVGIFGFQRLSAWLAGQALQFKYVFLTIFWLLCAFAVLSFCAKPLFNLTLMTSRFGRQVLTRAEKLQAILIAISIVLSLVGLIGFGLTKPFEEQFLLKFGMFFLFLLWPLDDLFDNTGLKRKLIVAVTALYCVCGFFALFHAARLIGNPWTPEALNAKLQETKDAPAKLPPALAKVAEAAGKLKAHENAAGKKKSKEELLAELTKELEPIMQAVEQIATAKLWYDRAVNAGILVMIVCVGVIFLPDRFGSS